MNINEALTGIVAGLTTEPVAPAAKEKLPTPNSWQRWLITSIKFNGTVEVIYGGNVIQEINFIGCDMDAAQRQTYKAGLPPTASLIAGFREKYPGVNMQWLKFDTDLEQFIRDYPRTRNTHLVRAYWPKLNNVEQWQSNRAAVAYRKYVERKQIEEKYVKLPENWLRKREFLNDWSKQF